MMIFKNIRKFFNKRKHQQSYACRLEDIDMSKNIATFYIKGSRVSLKIKINNVIDDLFLINNLYPIHASWIGFYYGQDMIKSNNTKESKRSMKLPQKNLNGNFKVMSYDVIKKHILYVDTKTNTTGRSNVIALAQDEHTLTNFDSMHAFYIGMLAGIEITKHKDTEFVKAMRPKLRVV